MDEMRSFFMIGRDWRLEGERECHRRRYIQGNDVNERQVKWMLLVDGGCRTTELARGEWVEETQ